MYLLSCQMPAPACPWHDTTSVLHSLKSIYWQFNVAKFFGSHLRHNALDDIFILLRTVPITVPITIRAPITTPNSTILNS